jgi:uncharacterized Zn-finger protein
VTTKTTTRLGRERIPGRTILSAIGDDESYPVLCPAPHDHRGLPHPRILLDVDDDGDASCHVCGLTIAGALPALP